MTDISFNVKEHEIRAIIGLNGGWQELDAELHQRGVPPPRLHLPRQETTFDYITNFARQRYCDGGKRTFQNLAIVWRQASVLDNIMSGRNFQSIRSNLPLPEALRTSARLERGRGRARQYVERIIDPRNPGLSQDPVASCRSTA